MLETNGAAAELAGLVQVGREVVSRVQSARVTFLAAAVAYYAFLSLLPALLLLLAVASALGGETLGNVVVDAAGGLLTPSGQAVVRSAFVSAAGRGGATVVGALVLLWSTLKVFRGLDIAFQAVYGTAGEPSLVDQIRDALVAVVGVGVAIGLMLVLGALLAASRFQIVAELLGIFVLPLLLTGVFLPLYYVFPDVDVTLREVAPGAVLAGVGWTALQAAFQLYAAGASQFQTYGVLGGILLLVTWFYLAASILLVGAVVNVVLAGRASPGSGVGPRGGEPPVGAPDQSTSLTPDHPTGRSPEEPGDRQLQHAPGPHNSTTPMAREDRGSGTGPDRTEATEPAGAPDITELQREVEQLRSRLAEFESDVESRTVEKPKLESELKRYVRKRLRRGHARGWGPYLVLLYGTVLTLGAFYWLDGAYAIAAMLVLGLSTLGLYVVFVAFGVGVNAAGVPFRALDTLRERRD